MGASSGIVLSQGLGRLRWRYRVGHRRGNALSECCPWGDVGQVAQQTRSPGGHRLRGRKGPCPALFLRMGELVQTQAGSPHHPLPRPDDRPSPRLTPGDTAKKPSPLALSFCPASLNYTSRGAPGSPGAGLTWAVGGGEGPARAASLSQCGALRGGHVPLFGAFVRARVCGCSECGQAARTEQVGAGVPGGGGGGGCRLGAARGTRPEGGAGSWQRPLAGGRRAGPRPQRGWRAGIAPLCVWLGRSLGFVPAPRGRGCGGEGARPAGRARCVSPGRSSRRQ